jgi:hypothetical protein
VQIGVKIEDFRNALADQMLHCFHKLINKA